MDTTNIAMRLNFISAYLAFEFRIVLASPWLDSKFWTVMTSSLWIWQLIFPITFGAPLTQLSCWMHFSVRFASYLMFIVVVTIDVVIVATLDGFSVCALSIRYYLASCPYCRCSFLSYPCHAIQSPRPKALDQHEFEGYVVITSGLRLLSLFINFPLTPLLQNCDLLNN